MKTPDRSIETGGSGARRVSSLIELALWLGLAAIAFGLSFRFSGEIGTYEWGAASWPRAVVLLMIIAALVNVWRRPRPAAVPSEERRHDGAALASLGLFLIPLAYAALLPRTGFYLTTPFFLIAYLLHGGERRWIVVLGTAALITLLANLVFTKLFFVALPVGVWPGFYEINTWLLTVIR